MKLGFIGQKGIPTLYGGIERHVEELSVRLAGLGHEVFVYTRPYYSPRDLKKYKGVNLTSLPSVKSKHLDAITHTLLATIHALFQDYDIIHYQGVGPSLLSFIPRILKPKTKVVTTFHCRDSVLAKWGAFAKLSLNLGEWTSVKFAHQTITVSRTLVNYIKNTYKGEVNYIPSGVPVPQHLPSSMITREFGLVEGNYFLSVARLIEDKGIHFLVKAYQDLKTDKKLVIVGDDSFTTEYVVQLKELAKKNPNIIFTNWQSGDMLTELYSNAYAFVHPSISEGLPVAVLEAASYGLPIVASDIPANLEVIGKYGLFFANKSILDLKDKMQLVLDNPEKIFELGNQVRERVRKNYNWDRVALETSNLYLETLGRTLEKELKIVQN